MIIFVIGRVRLRGGPIVISLRCDKYLQRYDDKRLKLATEIDSQGIERRPNISKNQKYHNNGKQEEMKANKGVNVDKNKIRDALKHVYCIKENCDGMRYDNMTNVGCQFNSKRKSECDAFKNDHTVKRLQNDPTLKCLQNDPRQELKHIYGIPRHIIEYSCDDSKIYTDIGVGSIKAFQKRNVRKIYLPETDEKGVGSSGSCVIRAKPETAVNGYYDHKRTSSKCVGGFTADNTQCISVNKKLSPILQTKTDTTSVNTITECRHVETGTNAEDEEPVTNEALFDTVNEVKAMVFYPETKKVETPVPESNLIKKCSPDTGKPKVFSESDKKPKISHTKEAEKTFSSDSLVNVHNLESPSVDKQSKISLPEVIDKLETDYKKIFTKVSEDNCISSFNNPDDEYNISSGMKHRFEALRQVTGKTDTVTEKDDSFIVDPSAKTVVHKDVSITSDPPSLISKSYSDTSKFFSEKTHNDTRYKNYEYSYKIDQQSLQWPENPTESEDGVKGMFKLWGQKYDFEQSNRVKNIKSPIPSVTFEEPVAKQKVETLPKKTGRKFFFFKKKSKDKAKEEFKPKENITTAGRCEINEGLAFKLARTGHNKRRVTKIAKEDEFIGRNAWLKKFLSKAVESAKSVNVRWNNSMYATSSSTVFDLLETIYKNTGAVFRSRSELSTESSYYRSFTKRKVNFVQDIQAWMIPNTILNKPIIPALLIKSREQIHENKDKQTNKQDFRVLNQKLIDKPDGFAQNIKVVLHTENYATGTKKGSSRFLRIDIPKDFFDYISSEESKNLTSDEKVFNIVEYDNNPDIEIVGNDVDDPTKKTVIPSTDVEVSVSFDSITERTLEGLNVNKPPLVKDAMVQRSNGNVQKPCDIIGVGIITQRDIKDVKQPILKIRDNLTDEEPDLRLETTHNKCEYADSYLQDYCRIAPLDVDLLSWCVSDCNVRSSSGNSDTNNSYSQGDGSKSCPNIYEYFQTALMSSHVESSSCDDKCLYNTASKGNKCYDKLLNFFKLNNSIEPKRNDINKDIRVQPKDSLEVFKRRKIYATSAKSQWIDNCKSGDKLSPDTSTDDACGTPSGDTSNAKNKKKRVKMPKIDKPDGIMQYRGASNKKDSAMSSKHAIISQEPSKEITLPHCLESCEKMKNPPCDKRPGTPPCKLPPCIQMKSPSTNLPPKNCSSEKCIPSSRNLQAKVESPCKIKSPKKVESPCKSETPSSPTCNPPKKCGSGQNSPAKVKSPGIMKSPKKVESPYKLGSPQPPACVPPKKCGSGQNSPARVESPGIMKSPKKVESPCKLNSPLPPPCDPPKTGCFGQNSPPKVESPGILKSPKKVESPCKVKSPRPPTCVTPKKCSSGKGFASGISLSIKIKSPCKMKSPKKVKSPGKMKSPKKVESPCKTESPKKIESPCKIKSPKKVESPCMLESPKKVDPPCATPKKNSSDKFIPSGLNSPKKVESPGKISSPRKVESPCTVCSPRKDKSPVTICSPKNKASANICINVKCPGRPESPSKISSPGCNPSNCPILNSSLNSSVNKLLKRGSGNRDATLSPKLSPKTLQYNCMSPQSASSEASLNPSPKLSKGDELDCLACKKCPIKLSHSNTSCKTTALIECNINSSKENLFIPSNTSVDSNPCCCPDSSTPTNKGVSLKMRPALSDQKNCSDDRKKHSIEACFVDECDRKQTLSRPVVCDQIMINLKEPTQSTCDITEPVNFKVTDDDGKTIYERTDYVRERHRHRHSPLLNLYTDSKINRASTPIQNIKNIATAKDDNHSAQSLANQIEIQFKLRVTQGDKTTEVNVYNDNDQKPNEKTEIQNTSPSVYVIKNVNDKVKDDEIEKNDINFKIVVKNFKPRHKDSDAVTVTDQFSRNISKKFHTVSTGYSQEAPAYIDNQAYSIHRATINLSSSEQQSKHSSMCNGAVSKDNSEVKVKRIASSNVNDQILADMKQDEKGESKCHVLEVKVPTNVTDRISADIIQNDAVTKKSDVIEDNIATASPSTSEMITDVKQDEDVADTCDEIVVNYTASSNCTEHINIDLTDDENVVEKSTLLTTPSETTSGSKQLELLDGTNTIPSEQADETDHTNPDTYTSTECISELVERKEDKKNLLKSVFEKMSKAPKNKQNVRTLRDMLKIVLTDSSDNDNIQFTSSELHNDATYTSLEPTNYFRMNEDNYLEDGSGALVRNIQKHNLSVDRSSLEQASYTDKNNGQCKGCICSKVADKLRNDDRPLKSGCCCRSTRKDEETNCDLRNDEDIFLLNYNTIECIDVQTQNSKFTTSKINSVNLSVHSKTISGISEKQIVQNMVVDHTRKDFKHVLRRNQFKKCDGKKRKGSLGISDDDIVAMRTDSTTHKSKASTNQRDIVKKADILQSYAVKKAVLEIYAEKASGGEHLVAKLPKFVY